jgi:plastocyanin
MAKQLIGIGTSANDGTGDTLRTGGDKVNDNFNEVYSAIGNGTTLQVSISNPSSGQVLRYNGTNFVASNYTELTSALDVNGNNIISSSNGNIAIASDGIGNITLAAGGVTSTFTGNGGAIDMPTTVKYKNEYTTLASAPAAADYPGYFFTVDGDDNPYVNVNITTGNVGDVRAKVVTEYSSIDLLSDVDTTTTAPTAGQVLKWNDTSSKWLPADDSAGIESINVFQTVAGDTGSTTANSQTDTLTIQGGQNITTTVSGDVVEIAFNGVLTTTFAALTDTDTSASATFGAPVQGDSLFYNGTNWVATRSPITWWELGSNGASHYTFDGPGFATPTDDPTLYVMRGMTYAFENTTGSSHPFRIQETTGLSGTAYTTGQSGSGQGTLYWTVPMNAPNTLYYQCTIHAAMNGTINVLN